MSNKELLEIIKGYKSLYLKNKKEFGSEHEWGVYNGLEIVQALIEERPAIYIRKDKTFNPHDINMYPEHFF
jgi:hypothetical protein